MPDSKIQRTFVLNEGDDKLITWMAEFLGCSKSDAVRSAVRAFATQLLAIDKRTASKELD